MYNKSMKKVLLFLISSSFLLPNLVSAQSVDLLWHGVGYTPPFYLGGSLWAQEGSAVLFAVPQGLGNPTQLDYKWIQDGTVLGSLSGVGRNTLTVTDPLFSKSKRIELQIIGSDEEILARQFLAITPVPPEVLIYEESPLLGFIFNREVSVGYQFSGQEVTFAAFPLFFSTSRADNGATYSWRSLAGEDSTENSVTYRIADDTLGSANISINITNPGTVRQLVEKNFLVQFGHEE